MDSAFYIVLQIQRVYTDTMYQYSPYTGMKRDSLELRYALSSFTMDSAVFLSDLSITGTGLYESGVWFIRCYFIEFSCFTIGKKVFWKGCNSSFIFCFSYQY